jgi:Family of unknown function (DUF5681)
MMADKVGYGSPPLHTRWKTGQSGNPRGRPKGARDFKTDLLAELAQVIQITEGGKTRSITKKRALIKALATNSIKGDTRASNILLRLCARLIEAIPDTGADAELSAADREIVDAYLERQVELRIASRKEED